jgi:anthranilate synthase component 2
MALAARGHRAVARPLRSGAGRDLPAADPRRGRNPHPLLGVCLGHQTIGEAFGGKVVRCHEIVHGKMGTMHHAGQGVFRGLPSPFQATRYHSLVVERESLPAALKSPPGWRTARSWACATATNLIEGVQFHPESIASEHGHQLLRNFLTRPA